MCTIAILVGVVADAPLVLAANRDELYARKTRPPERLGPHTAGGVDEQSGGTWLAVRANGRFAAVTNQRALAPPKLGVRSRGHAVKELALADDQLAYVRAIDPTHYASMNLVWGDARGVWIAYSRNEGSLDIEQLAPGVHTLCNDRLLAEGFPRCGRLAAMLQQLLVTPELSALLAGLPAALGDHTRQEPTVATHLPHALERELTANCIHSESYGTRSATLFAASALGALAYRHADGPPCVTPFIDRMELLT